MQSSIQAPAMRLSRHFDASCEEIFDAWLERDVVGAFFFGTEDGEMVRAELDGRVGGAYLFVDRRDGEDVEHAGEYLEIDRPRRLVFTFAVPRYVPGVTRVAIEIVPDGAGSMLTLTHDRVDPDYLGDSETGFAFVLDRLAAALS